MMNVFDNIFWASLSGPHAKFASGTDRALRYARGFSPIVAFPDATRPDFGALLPFCEPGEHFYCEGWSGPAPEGWVIEAETTMFLMVHDAPAPLRDPAPDAVALGPEHAQQAYELAMMTRPGPFGVRTPEMGEYFGYVDNGRLVAMAGERTAAAGVREISGVCTHPDYQGRGYARRLMEKLAMRQLARGETPYLHVMSTNTNAHALYLRMGFKVYKESVVRVVAPVPASALLED